jgi:hypothetical protein
VSSPCDHSGSQSRFVRAVVSIRVSVNRLRRFVRSERPEKRRLKIDPNGETESRDHEGKIKAAVPVPGNSAPRRGKR